MSALLGYINEFDEIIELNAEQLKYFKEVTERNIEKKYSSEDFLDNYILGYLMYNISTQDIRKNIDVKELIVAHFFLERCYAIDSTDDLAKYYLIFSSFDLKMYDKSLEIIGVGNFFKNNNILWRHYKIIEIEFCCKLYLANSISDFNLLISESINFFIDLTKNEDDENYNTPMDLILSFFKDKKEIYEENRAKLIDFINLFEVAEVFEKEYDMLIKNKAI